jgi:hypothetical protein
MAYAKTLQRMLGQRTKAFVTRVANAASQKIDCAAKSALFDDESGNSLSVIAAKDVLASRHGHKVCAPKVAAKK